MKTAMLAILVLSPFCIGAQLYPPQGEWRPDLLGWHFENAMQAPPARVASRPAPDFDEADGTRYIEVLAMLPAGSQIGCVGIAIIPPRLGDTPPIKVAQVWPGSLAAAAGIKPNSFIISVDGVNAVGMSARRFLSSAFGPVGTFVTLDLADPAMSQTNKITIKREPAKYPYFEFQPFKYTRPAIFDSPPKAPEPLTAVGAVVSRCIGIHVARTFSI